MPEYLYVIRRGDAVRKVGRSCDPSQRLHQIYREGPKDISASLVLEYQVECAAEHVAKAETYAHCLLRDWRYEGEWFEIDADAAREAVDAAAAIAAQGGQFPKPKVERLQICMTPSMREAIKHWRHRHFIDTEMEAVRQLIRLGLQADGINIDT